MYSTTPDDVNTMMTEPQFSGTDTTLTDQVYTVRLEDLVPGTTYYYQIKVENTVGITLTEVLTFSTRKVSYTHVIQYFNGHLYHYSFCGTTSKLYNNG